MITNTKPGLVAVICFLSSMLVLALSGNLLTSTYGNYNGTWSVSGPSDLSFLFITSCISATFLGLLIIMSFREDHAEQVLRTHYFLAMNGLLLVFYVCSSIAVLSNSNTHSSYGSQRIAAGVFGLFTGFLHGGELMLKRMSGYDNI